MEFAVGAPSWESPAASMERREKEIKAAESITWATSQTEVEEAAIEEAMATVTAREAEAAGAAAAVEVRAAWSEEANAWVKNESVSPVSAAVLPVPMVAVPTVTTAAAVAAAAAKWRRRERRLRQAQLQIFLERSATLSKRADGSCARAHWVHIPACVRVQPCAWARITHAGSGMSALRRGDETMARLLEDSAKRRPHSARVDAEVETARSLSLNPTCDNITPADLQPQDLGRDPHPPTSPRPTSAVRRNAASPFRRPASAQPATPRPATVRPATARPATARPATARPATASPRDTHHRCPATACGGGAAGGCWRVVPPLSSGRAAGVSPRPHTAEPRAPPPPSPSQPSQPFRKPAPRPASAVARQGHLAALVTGNPVVEPRAGAPRPHALYPLTSGQWGACTRSRLAPQQPCSSRAAWC